MMTGYCAIVPQTHEEKMEMYMRLSKEELAEMLINASQLHPPKGGCLSKG